MSTVSYEDYKVAAGCISNAVHLELRLVICEEARQAASINWHPRACTAKDSTVKHEVLMLLLCM